MSALSKGMALAAVVGGAALAVSAAAQAATPQTQTVIEITGEVPTFCNFGTPDAPITSAITIGPFDITPGTHQESGGAGTPFTCNTNYKVSATSSNGGLRHSSALASAPNGNQHLDYKFGWTNVFGTFWYPTFTLSNEDVAQYAPGIYPPIVVNVPHTFKIEYTYDPINGSGLYAGIYSDTVTVQFEPQ